MRSWITLVALIAGASCSVASPGDTGPSRVAGNGEDAELTGTRSDDAAAPGAIVLVMSDDQGWGDLGLMDRGVRTPALDEMFRAGVMWKRFYAAAPVCSPTRASVLTGRHPARLGIDGANDGHLPQDEVCLAEILKANGYATGFFGKWHLGTLTRDVVDSNRGGRPKNDAHYSPPWEHGFDVVFATEAKVPTFDPMLDPRTEKPYGTRYWTGPGEAVDPESLGGDDSALVVTRAIAFLEDARERGKPAFAVVWLHAPHEPVVASPAQLASLQLSAEDARDRYVACLADVDAQVGALVAALDGPGRGPGVLFYCSDNGPEHKDGPGSTGGLRGRKRDLFEGGIRVPAAMWWTQARHVRLAGWQRGTTVPGPASTVDYLPTVLELAGVELELARLDGTSLLGTAAPKDEPAGRQYGFRSDRQRAYLQGRWKIHSADGGSTWALYDIESDPAEQVDRCAAEPERAAELVAAFQRWEDDVLRDREDAPAAAR